MGTPIADLVTRRRRGPEQIVDVLVAAFEDLIESDPHAFRKKFRKMAADPFPFYRGTRRLFYADVAGARTRGWTSAPSGCGSRATCTPRTTAPTWTPRAMLVFDVNDFDEAYLGHYTWDLQRMAASLALLGFGKALSDETIEQMIVTYGRAYVEQVRAFATGDRDEEFRLTLETTDGLLQEFLQSARAHTRLDLLESTTTLEGHARRFSDGPGVRRLDDDERESVLEAYGAYLETIPETKRQQSVSYDVKDVVGRKGFGIGSAGLPAYNLLVEGRTQALDNDVVLSMKQGNIPAPSRVVDNGRLHEYFKHQGHRTAVSQRALQAHSDPWLGWCELGGEGQVVQELSPYENDLDWGSISEPDEILPLLRYLGQATAKVHCVSDAASDQPLVDFEIEEALMEAIGDEDERFAADLAEFGAAYGELARDDHRRFVDAFRNGAIPGVGES